MTVETFLEYRNIGKEERERRRERGASCRRSLRSTARSSSTWRCTTSQSTGDSSATTMFIFILPVSGKCDCWFLGPLCLPCSSTHSKKKVVQKADSHNSQLFLLQLGRVSLESKHAPVKTNTACIMMSSTCLGMLSRCDNRVRSPLMLALDRPGETSLWHRHSENTLYMCVGHAAAALNRPTDKVRWGFSTCSSW